MDVASNSGPLPKWCKPCGEAHAKALMRARGKRRTEKTRGVVATLEFSCADCGTKIDWNGRGRPKLRCDPCRTARNKEKQRETTIAWMKANPERVREIGRRGYKRNVESIRLRRLATYYQYRYGISREDWDAMLDRQGGKCAICKGEPHPNHHGRRFHVDHCHATNRIRGLLCGNCNTALGLFKDDPERLASAIAYLASATSAA